MLEVEARREIYETLRESPGAHFSHLQRLLGMATGTLQYHLKVLEDRNLIEVDREGRYTRYFVSLEVEQRDRQLLGLLRQETARRVMLHLLEQGLSRLTDVSDALGLAPSTVSFHLGNLEEAGVVEKPERGKYRLVDAERVEDVLVAYQESFSDHAVDRMVSLLTGLGEGGGGASGG